MSELGAVAGVCAAILCGLLALFQLALAAGAPLGRAVWGGQHRVLPAKLRWGSVAAAVILVGVAWVALARVQLLPPADSGAIGIAAWVFAGYFTLNIVANLASKSRTERLVMTPVATLVAGCLYLVALA